VFTKSGFSARVVSSHRPPVPILALTDTEKTARQLALVWGVHPVPLTLAPRAGEHRLEFVVRAAFLYGAIRPGERVVLLAEERAGGAPWFRLAYEEALQETPFTFRGAAALTDPANRVESCAANRGPDSAPLLLLNHWVAMEPLPLPSDAEKVNAYEPLLARARECERIRGQIPNLIAVNFYRRGDLFRVVDTLNGVG
jgi:hypothetical protein